MPEPHRSDAFDPDPFEADFDNDIVAKQHAEFERLLTDTEMEEEGAEEEVESNDETIGPT